MSDPQHEEVGTMGVLDTILVPIDGSKRSEVALQYASMLAELTGARLVVFTAVAGVERETLDAFAASEGISVAEAADAYLGRAASICADGVDVTVWHSLDEHAAEAILDTARDLDASLIVMASHGRSGFTRWLLGSVTDKVVQSSTIPVVIVPTRQMS